MESWIGSAAILAIWYLLVAVWLPRAGVAT